MGIYTTVQSMGHGDICHCTTHGPRTRYTALRSMTHGVSEIRSFLSIFLTLNSFFPQTLILLTHVLTFAMISPHVLSPLFHFAFTIRTKSEPLRTPAKSIRTFIKEQELSTRKVLHQAPSPTQSCTARHHQSTASTPTPP